VEKSTLKKIIYVICFIISIKYLVGLGKFFFYENGAEHLEKLSNSVAKPFKTLSNMN